VFFDKRQLVVLEGGNHTHVTITVAITPIKKGLRWLSGLIFGSSSFTFGVHRPLG